MSLINGLGCLRLKNGKQRLQCPWLVDRENILDVDPKLAIVVQVDVHVSKLA